MRRVIGPRPMKKGLKISIENHVLIKGEQQTQEKII
jgi:hypothetical protein